MITRLCYLRQQTPTIMNSLPRDDPLDKPISTISTNLKTANEYDIDTSIDTILAIAAQSCHVMELTHKYCQPSQEGHKQ